MKNSKHLGLAAVLLVFLAIPAVAGPYYINLLITFGIFAILTYSMDIVTGYIGEITLGQAAFFGLGAYASALLAKNLGLPFWLSLPAAAIICAIFGLIIGYITLRLRGAYFAIITLAFAEILRLIAINWAALTNGPMGLTKIPPPAISIPGLFRFELNSEVSYYYLIMFFVLATILFVHRVMKSSYGREFLAVREQEALARSIGINAFGAKILAFVLSTMLAGIAGSLYAHYFRIISPEQIGVYYTATALIMTFLGGRGSLLGPLIGAFVYSIIPELINIESNMRLIIFSSLLLLSLLFMPDGLAKGISDLMQKIKRSQKGKATFPV